MADSNSARTIADTAAKTPSKETDSCECIVAIDPGSAKCGLAVVTRHGAVPFRSVVNTPNLADELVRVVLAYRPCEIILGDGTGSKHLLDTIRNTLPVPLPIRSVPEAHTSEEARKRFVKEVQPRGLQRLLPAALRTPSRPYDDYVAVILGERYWQTQNDESHLPDNAP
jgi:RNase H-fold protein (predicted Holliday junction resolvase)